MLRRLAVRPAVLAPAAALLCAAVLAPAGVAGAATTAGPKTESATLGTVTATFSYATGTEQGEWKDLHVTVSRAGVVAFDGKPDGGPDCGEPYCAPASVFTELPAVRVVDLDGDGEPEVIVDLYTGGAHCCEVAEILRWDGARYVASVRNFADFGYTIDPAATPGAPATFVTGDDRFAYAFASFADSAFPVRLLTFGGAAGWRDVTRAHPETLKADAARWLKAYKKARKADGYPLGVLAAWVADEYRLGTAARATADRYLASELRAGRLKGDPYWPRGKTFVSTLKRRLRVWGYAA